MNLADLPWTDIRAALDGDRPVVAILPCGAVEAHGPHLPLSTDVIISEGMAKRAAEMLEAEGIRAFILPPLAYAPAHYAAEFAGTISVRETTAKAMIADIAASLAQQGFACLAFANSHFDPANVAMLREAVRAAEASGLRVAFPDFTRRALAQTLTDEFISGACHAGQFETSLVMADRPDLVRDALRVGLEENPASLLTAFEKGATTFSAAGGPEAYFGAPGEATAAEGHSTSQIMAKALTAAILEAISP